jgi:hypothetical protein
MNNKPISIIIAGTVLGSLITTTSYAWQSPSQACVDTRNDLSRVMYVIQRCKNSDPYGSWICGSNPLRSVVSEIKNNCLAILQHECHPDVVDDPGVVYDLNALEPVCPSVVGAWEVSKDADCDGVEDANHTTIYNDDLTWNGVDFPNGGDWTQDGCNIAMADFSFNPPIIWHAMLGGDGDLLYDGIFSGMFNGCWTATRIYPPSPSNAVSAPENAEE